MIKFGMWNCLITYRNKYYEYSGHCDANSKRLTISGYESAFLADLAAAYLLEMTKDCFENSIYNGIYRDDGINVVIGHLSKYDIK